MNWVYECGEPWCVVGKVGVTVVTIELRHPDATVLKKSEYTLHVTVNCREQHVSFQVQQCLLCNDVRIEAHISSSNILQQSLRLHSL